MAVLLGPQVSNQGKGSKGSRSKLKGVRKRRRLAARPAAGDMGLRATQAPVYGPNSRFRDSPIVCIVSAVGSGQSLAQIEAEHCDPIHAYETLHNKDTSCIKHWIIRTLCI